MRRRIILILGSMLTGAVVAWTALSRTHLSTNSSRDRFQGVESERA
jgi:hypothetical protein